MLNKVTMIGRIGNVESRTLPNGTVFTKLSLANSQTWKKDGVKQEKTTWFSVHAYAKIAEIMAEYGKVGDLICIDGALKQEKYTDKSGVEKISTVIVPTEFYRLSSKDAKGTSQQQQKPATVGAPGLLDDDIPW